MVNSRFRFIDIVFIVFTFFILPNYSYSLDCFSKSPSIQEGRGMFDAVKTRKLTPDEYLALSSLFKSLDGDWIGNGYLMFCTGNIDDIVIDTEHLTIEAECKTNRDIHFLLTSDITSPVNKTNYQKSIEFYLKEEILSSSGFKSESDIEIISASENDLTYVKKIIRKVKTKKEKKTEIELYPGIKFFIKKRTDKKKKFQQRIVNEIITSIIKTSESSFMVERVYYLQGILKMKEAWHLNR